VKTRKSTLDEVEFRSLKEVLGRIEKITVRVVSGSMEPCIRTGEQIEVSRLRARPRRFDILTFWNGQVIMCHYLWHTNEYLTNPDGQQVYVTRALRRGSYDAPITESQILGRVVSHRLSAWARFRIVLFTFFFRKLKRGILSGS
jgi:hypothetical protein